MRWQVRFREPGGAWMAFGRYATADDADAAAMALAWRSGRNVFEIEVGRA